MSLLEDIRALGPPEYRVVATSTRSDEELESARRGVFTVFGREVTLDPPVDWNQDPFGSRSGVYELHTLQCVDVLVRSSLESGNAAPLAQACAIGLDWIRANPPNGETTNQFAWYDMAVALRAPYLAYVLRAAAHADVLEQRDAETLLESLREHGQFLAASENYADGYNHGLFEDEGLLLLADYLPVFAQSQEWHEIAWRRCLETLRKTIDWHDGVHLEHSPAYHLAMTHFVRRIVELPGADKATLGCLLAKLEDTAGWLVLPDGTLPELGDTDSVPAARWALQSSAGKRGLRVLGRAGFGIIKEPESFLIVSAGYHGRGHKHADELGFVLYEEGQRILCDSGRYGYYEDEPARRYARSSYAHNALVVDGENFEWQSAEPYGSGITRGGAGLGWYAVEGTNPLLSGVEHHRLFLFQPGIVLVVVDEVRSEHSRMFSRLLHFGQTVGVEEGDGRLILRIGTLQGSVAQWSNSPTRWHLSRGRREPELRGWSFPGDREWVPIWTAELDSTGVGLTSAIAIAIGDRTVSVRDVWANQHETSVALDLAGRTRVVTAVRGAGEIEIIEGEQP